MCINQNLGYTDCVTHWAPVLTYASGLCGAMAVSFLAHIALGARLPQDDQQLRSRSWDMKQKFVTAIDVSTAMPVYGDGWAMNLVVTLMNKLWPQFTIRFLPLFDVGNVGNSH